MLFPENMDGKKKIDLSQDTEFEMTNEKTLVSMCVCQRKRGNCTVGRKFKNLVIFFCFGMKKSLCNKIFCCYSHKNMYEIYLTSFSSLYKDNRNVSLVINLMWKVVLHTVSHVRVYFPNAWIIFFTVHTDPYFLRLLQSLFCCLAFYT